MLLSAFGLTSARAEQDCELAQRYVDLAHQRQNAMQFDDAIAFLQHAVDSCPNYEAYQALGDLQARSPQRHDRARAVDALVAAYQLAPSDATQAAALFSYARVLNQDGDPGNAYPLIKNAQTLDPANTEISQLAGQLEQRINNPTKATLSRGLWDSLYKPLPLRLASNVTRASTGPAKAPDKPAVPPLNQQPTDTLPINFETGTTIVDGKTRSNIAVLAQALGDPNHKDQHYIFIGHADVRGIEQNNFVLSKRRAEAIYQSVILLEPSLQGRIDIEGKGSSEPIDLGNSEEAYRRNRRLQVLLKQDSAPVK
jgi:outer membrane protein OmpA-like peptidoglycan-associated protein